MSKRKSAALKKSPSTKRPKGRAASKEIVQLYEAVSAGLDLDRPALDRVDELVRNRLTTGHRRAVAALTLGLAGGARGYIEKHPKPPEPTIEQQDAIRQKRLMEAEERCGDAIGNIDEALARFAAVETLSLEWEWQDDDGPLSREAKRKSFLTAMTALGQVGRDELQKVRDTLEGLDLCATVTADQVANFERARAGAAQKGGGDE